MICAARALFAGVVPAFRAKGKRLGRDEDGQAIIFAVVMLSVIVLVLLMGVNVAYETNRRVELQSAADAAALSAAAVHNRVDDALGLLNTMVVTLLATQTILQDDWFYLTALGYYLKSFPPWACSDCEPLGDSLLRDSTHYRTLITSVHQRLINPGIQSLGDTSEYLHTNVPQMAAQAALVHALGNRAEKVLLYPEHAVPWRLVPVESNADLIVNSRDAHGRRGRFSYPRVGGPSPNFTGLTEHNYQQDRDELSQWAARHAPLVAVDDRPSPTPPPPPELPSFPISGRGLSYTGSDCRTGRSGCADALAKYIAGTSSWQISGASELTLRSRLFLEDTQGKSSPSASAWINYISRIPNSKKQVDKTHLTDFQIFKACYLSDVPVPLTNPDIAFAGYSQGFQETCRRVFVKDWGTTDTYVLFEEVKGCKIPLTDPVSGLGAQIARGLWPLSIPRLYMLEPEARQKTHQLTAIVYQEARPSLLLKNRFHKTRHGNATHAATQCGMAWASAEVFNREDPGGSSPGWACRLHPALGLDWLAAASAPEGEDAANSALRQAIGRIRDSEAAATRRDWHDTLAH